MVIRQQALATAQIFIRRFYLKVEIRRTNPYLLVATALYLACKMEECPQHIRVVVSEARHLWSGKYPRQVRRRDPNCLKILSLPMSLSLENASSSSFPR